MFTTLRFTRGSGGVFPRMPGLVQRCATWSVLLLAAAASLYGADKGDLKRLVVVGDSLTAGFQNFSLYHRLNAKNKKPLDGQTFGYAAQVAKQAGVDLKLPLISYPGIPPALTMSGDMIVREGGLGSRTVFDQTFNLSVPGFTVLDAISHVFPGDLQNNPIDLMSYTVLFTPGSIPACGPLPGPGGLVISELTCAIALQPTTVLVSIGNNDALQALTLGLPPTDPKVFAAQYAVVMLGLAATRAKIVVANIPDVSALPFLVPVPVAQASCPPGPIDAEDPTSFVVPDITNPAATTFDICTNYQVRTSTLVAQAQTAIKSYNTSIAAQAKLFGAAVVDFNGLFAGIAVNGYKLSNGKILTTAFTTADTGGLFSLDGVHPTNTGYAILANKVIDTMNDSFM